jgi:hypothetical protein
MIECFKSANSKYTFDNDKYFKNGIDILDENGKDIDAYTFKQLIKNIYLNIRKCERKQYNDTPFL